MDNNKKAKYIEKKMQSNFYQNQDVECGKWLINMQEQMIETRKWKGMSGLKVESVLCRLCEQYDETVDYLLAGCTVLAGTGYARRHNDTLMVLAVQWGKQH